MSPAAKKLKWAVSVAQGEQIIEGTRAEYDAGTTRITFWDGDDVVASYAGNSFRRIKE